MKKKIPKKKTKYMSSNCSMLDSPKKKKKCSMLNYKVGGVKYSSYLVQ